MLVPFKGCVRGRDWVRGRDLFRGRGSDWVRLGIGLKGTKRQSSGQMSQNFPNCKNYRNTISQAN